MNKIRGLFVSVAHVLKHAAKTGEVMATAEIVHRRLELCRQCADLVGSKCVHCGCFMALKGGLAATKCPINKW